MVSDNPNNLYCADDDVEHRIYCNICDNICIDNGKIILNQELI